MIDTTRHQSLIDGVDLGKTIEIVGCGSVGTAAATTLVRLGYTKFALIDPDKVEVHNIANQYFDSTDIGKEKTEALKEKLLRMNPGLEITTYTELHAGARRQMRYKEPDIKIVAVDSMAARLEIYKNKNTRKEQLIIDTRMGGEDAIIITYQNNNKQHRKQYEDTLYPDKDAAPISCTAKTVIYTISVIGGLITKIVKDSEQEEEKKYKSYALSMKNMTITKLQ